MKISTLKCMLVLVIASTFACGQSVHFSDDFEGQTLGALGNVSAPVGTWKKYGVNTTNFIDIVDAGDSHGQVMRVYGAGAARAQALFASSQTQAITVSYDIKVVEPTASGYGTCYQWIKNTTQGWDQHGTTISLRKDWSGTEGRFYHGNTSYTVIPLSKYAYQWYNVEITFSAIPAGGVMGVCDVKVIRESTGEVVVDKTGVPRDGLALTAFNGFEFTGSGTHLDVYVDNLVVSSERTAAPVFTPDGGSSENSQTITITSTPDAVIRYTLDGSEPTTSSTEYTAPITINRTTMVKAKAWASGYYESVTAPKLFTITYPGTYFLDDLEGQTVGDFNAGGPAMVGSWDQLISSGGEVEIKDLGGEHGKVIHYDGTTKYLRAKFATQQGPISVTFDYKAADTTNNGYGYSYTHMGYTALGWDARSSKIAFTKGWGATEAKAYYGANYVNMSLWDYFDEWFHVEATFPAVEAGSPLILFDVRVIRESDGEVIFDETNVANAGGSALTAYDVYIFTGAGDSADMYIDNMTVTEVRTAIPTFSLIGGTYIGDQDITLSCSTPGAAIYYTTNGSEPTTNSTLFVADTPITVSMPTTLKAKAFAAGYVDSCVASVSYEGPAYGRPALIAHGSVVVDGDLTTDWADADWVPLDKTYDISDSTQAALDADIPEAYYAAKWNDSANKVYVAVKVRDTGHSFSMGYGTWTGRDAVEIYLHTTGGAPVHYYPSESSAQQYVVGIQSGSTDVVWESLTNLGIMPDNTNFSSAGSVVGEWIYYEVAMTPFEFFAGFTGDPDVVDDLEAGDIIGLDVCVVGHDGTNYAGMKSENAMTGKSNDWTQFALHTLEDATQIPGDANNDGSVDVGDLGILAANYGTASGATWELGDFNGDGAVDVGDLGILAANYGTGSSSSADFDADYAKVFGDDASVEETADDSVCALLGLPLIAGLALLGLMLVKLDD